MYLSTATMALESSGRGSLSRVAAGEEKGGDSGGSPNSDLRGEWKRRGESGAVEVSESRDDDFFMALPRCCGRSMLPRWFWLWF